MSLTSISSEWIINLRFASSKAKKHIILLGGTDTKTTRLPGYSIRVSNESTLTSALICYQDPGNTTLPDIIEKECHMTGQFIWLYQDNIMLGPCPMLELCEVQIFGRFRIYWNRNVQKTNTQHLKHNTNKYFHSLYYMLWIDYSFFKLKHFLN